MLNLLIYEKNIYNCKKIINSVAHLDFYIKIYSIVTSPFELEETLITSNINLIILDVSDENISNVNFLQEKILKKYNIPIIVLAAKINNYDYNISPNIIFLDSYDLLYDKLVSFTSNYYNSNNLKLIISRELDYLCFNSNHIGTIYLIEVISQVYYNYALLNNLTKLVYPNIARKYSISINTLKCDIFQSALCSYVTCEEYKLEAYLGRSCMEKPSVKTYICSIIEHNRVENK